MNNKQYNNIIEHTLINEQSAQTGDSLATARAIFDNMGVSLPQGDMKTVYETIKTDDYMGWKSCTKEEAQAAADKGIAAIGISEDKIIVLSANDEEQPVAQTASVMTLNETVSPLAVEGIEYYAYNGGTTCSGDCCGNTGNTGNSSVSYADLPPLFKTLINENLLLFTSQIESTSDGFFMCKKPLSYIFNKAGIDKLKEDRPCSTYYDDWYLYSIYKGTTEVYSLVKMREQETDGGDNNDPGVTICFIAFNTNLFLNCLHNKTDSDKLALYNEIQRVVGDSGQTHDDDLYEYFNNPAALAPYTIAELYIQHIASRVSEHLLRLPNKYLDILSEIRNLKIRIMELEESTDPDVELVLVGLRQDLEDLSRVPNFIENLNRNAGRTVCSDNYITLLSPSCLSDYEKYAILATHTGNVSLNSFAAEVKFHALMLGVLDESTRILIDPLYFLNPLNYLVVLPIYEKAIRADIAIGEADSKDQLADPYYDLDSNIVQEQVQYHGLK